MAQDEYQTFKLGDWELQSGEKILDARIAYNTFGDPKNPAILYPSWFSGLLSDNYWLIGEDKTLNPKKYFIIVTGLFGNSQSSSPSNQSVPRRFPKVTFYDNVRAQHTLLKQHFGIKHLYAVIGWSMGGAQSYQWATQYPDFMDLVVPFCTSARTSLHNQVFLEGVKCALLSAKHVQSAGSGDDGVVESGQDYRIWSDKEREVGLKAFGRVYAGWGMSQAFYREKVYETDMGFKNLEDFMQNYWEKWALSKHPENLLVMLRTWQNGDVSKQPAYNGNFEKALDSIRAKILILPGKTDLYFPPEDSEYEVKCIRPELANFDVFPSIWGHWAGGPGESKKDVEWLDKKIGEFFSKNKPTN